MPLDCVCHGESCFFIFLHVLVTNGPVDGQGNPAPFNCACLICYLARGARKAKNSCDCESKVTSHWNGQNSNLNHRAFSVFDNYWLQLRLFPEQLMFESIGVILWTMTGSMLGSFHWCSLIFLSLRTIIWNRQCPAGQIDIVMSSCNCKLVPCSGSWMYYFLIWAFPGLVARFVSIKNTGQRSLTEVERLFLLIREMVASAMEGCS